MGNYWRPRRVSESPHLTDQLQKVSAYYGTPEWMTRDYQEASKAILATEYGRAVTLLKNVVQDGKERPVQLKARNVLQDLEQQAAGRLVRESVYDDRGQSTEAAETLTDLLRNYPGTQAATDGGALLTTLAISRKCKPTTPAPGQGAIRSGRDEYRTQQYLDAFTGARPGVRYSDLPEGAEAMHSAAEIKDNPDLMDRACDSLKARTAAMYLTLAESWIKRGQPARRKRAWKRSCNPLRAVPGTRNQPGPPVRSFKGPRPRSRRSTRSIRAALPRSPIRVTRHCSRAIRRRVRDPLAP